jgi:hypothetical protein
MEKTVSRSLRRASSDLIMIRMFLEAEGSRRDATVELQDSVRLLGGYVR